MSLIKELLAENGIDVTNEQAKKLFKFCELLRLWNKTHSLTSMRKDEEFNDAILDSVYPLTFLNDFKSALDIGSGAGFPAMPLAILKSDANFTLCEPLSKKYAFLQFAKLELELNNVTVKKNRVEELEGSEFEMISSRAVANSQVLIELSSPLLKTGGNWLFYKGERSAAEIEGKNVQIYTKNRRHYVLIRKES
ncbi:MAG: 16S rRNA (guanine(527)-N(7))-methyltransferase RsmG [Campylobacterales bacterium]